LRGHDRQDVHVGSEVPPVMLLLNGLLDWIISSTSAILSIKPVMVFLPVGQVPQ